MFVSATCQRDCLTEEIDDAAPISIAQEHKIIMQCKSFVDVCNNIFRTTWRSFVMRRLKNSARSAEIPRDSIDHGTHRTLSAANKNNPICANTAEFESPSIAAVHQFAFSLKKGLLPRVPSSFENYRFSMLDSRRESAAVNKQKNRGRQPGWNMSRFVDTPRKTAEIRRKIRFDRIRGSTTNQRDDRRGNRGGSSVLPSPWALSYFPSSHDQPEMVPRVDSCRAIPHARMTTSPFKRSLFSEPISRIFTNQSSFASTLRGFVNKSRVASYPSAVRCTTNSLKVTAALD